MCSLATEFIDRSQAIRNKLDSAIRNEIFFGSTLTAKYESLQITKDLVQSHLTKYVNRIEHRDVVRLKALEILVDKVTK